MSIELIITFDIIETISLYNHLIIIIIISWTIDMYFRNAVINNKDSNFFLSRKDFIVYNVAWMALQIYSLIRK